MCAACAAGAAARRQRPPLRSKPRSSSDDRTGPPPGLSRSRPSRPEPGGTRTDPTRCHPAKAPKTIPANHRHGRGNDRRGPCDTARRATGWQSQPTSGRPRRTADIPDRLLVRAGVAAGLHPHLNRLVRDRPIRHLRTDRHHGHCHIGGADRAPTHPAGTGRDHRSIQTELLDQPDDTAGLRVGAVCPGRV